TSTTSSISRGSRRRITLRLRSWIRKVRSEGAARAASSVSWQSVSFVPRRAHGRAALAEGPRSASGRERCASSTPLETIIGALDSARTPRLRARLIEPHFSRDDPGDLNAWPTPLRRMPPGEAQRLADIARAEEEAGRSEAPRGAEGPGRP